MRPEVIALLESKVRDTWVVLVSGGDYMPLPADAPTDWVNTVVNAYQRFIPEPEWPTLVMRGADENVSELAWLLKPNICRRCDECDKVININDFASWGDDWCCNACDAADSKCVVTSCGCGEDEKCAECCGAECVDCNITFNRFMKITSLPGEPSWLDGGRARCWPCEKGMQELY